VRNKIRERCKGNRQKERGAVATDYRDKGGGAYREGHMTSATQEISYTCQGATGQHWRETH
jgi:hypothetical protein